MKAAMEFSTWIRCGIVLLALPMACLVLSAGCTATADGDRCNPLLSHDECANSPTEQCTWIPSTNEGTTPAYACAAGLAFCCAHDANGTITSTSTNCQFLAQCQRATYCQTQEPDAGDDGGLTAFVTGEFCSLGPPPTTPEPDAGSSSPDASDGSSTADGSSALDTGSSSPDAADGSTPDAADGTGD